MSILHRYILKQFLRNVALFLLIATGLFIAIDFFDRIDLIVADGGSAGLTALYFLFKIPQTVQLTLPIAVLVATLFTVGILSKNSEITAMRTAGLSLWWLAKPLYIAGALLGLGLLIFGETVVPYTARRAYEIYNIDIRKKDKAGTYSRDDFWWRSGSTFYSSRNFDSRDNTLIGVSSFELSPDFQIKDRIDAARAKWINPDLGWSMNDVTEYHFSLDGSEETKRLTRHSLPLPIKEPPQYFYDVRIDSEAMSFRGLRRHMRKLTRDGISTAGYTADLYSKLTFPWVCLVVILTALPFALKPARSGTMTLSFVSGLAIGFSYFIVNSFSISLGRAELLPPLVAALSANLLLGFIGLVLNWGAEAP